MFFFIMNINSIIKRYHLFKNLKNLIFFSKFINKNHFFTKYIYIINVNHFFLIKL